MALCFTTAFWLAFQLGDAASGRHKRRSLRKFSVHAALRLRKVGRAGGCFAAYSQSRLLSRAAYTSRPAYEVGWSVKFEAESYDEFTRTLMEELTRQALGQGQSSSTWVSCAAGVCIWCIAWPSQQVVYVLCGAPLWVAFLVTGHYCRRADVIFPIDYFPNPFQLHRFA